MKKAKVPVLKRAISSTLIWKIISIAFFLGLSGLSGYIFSKETIDQNLLSSLQMDIQVLRSQLRQMEANFVQIDRGLSMGSSKNYVKEDFAKVILWQQLMIDVSNGNSFREPLEKILELCELGSEKFPDITWLLEQSLQGIPTPETLFLMIDQYSDPLSLSSSEGEENFWFHPLKYMKSLIDWDKFFIVRTQAHEKIRKKLHQLVARRFFAEALDILKDYPAQFQTLEKSLKDCLRGRVALKFLQEKIMHSLTTGGKDEK